LRGGPNVRVPYCSGEKRGGCGGQEKKIWIHSNKHLILLRSALRSFERKLLFGRKDLNL
jgi:hypothetical protein